MRKLMYLLGFIILVSMPAVASAAQFRTGERGVNVGSGETVNDDLYIASDNVSIDGSVTGDLAVAGGTVNVNGSVGEDLYSAGGNITVNGPVGDDLRVAGGTITINSTVADDLFIAGGTVLIGRSANITGEVYVSGGQVTISGTTGRIKAAGGELTITNGARVNGDVLFYSENEPRVDNGATVTGSVTRRDVPGGKDDAKGIVAFLASFAIIMAIASILLGILLVYLFPNAAVTMANTWKENFWWSLLWGFLFLVVVPIAILMLFLTVIGIPLAIGLMLLYPVLMYLGRLIGIFGIGYWILRATRKDVPYGYLWLAVLIGSVIFYILGIIPVLGWLLKLVITLSGLGTLFIFLSRIGSRLRKEKAI